MLPLSSLRCTTCCFRSDENGNLLYSAFFIVMNGDNRYVDDLKMLASIELYLNSVFYSKHPPFAKVMNSYSCILGPYSGILVHGTTHYKEVYMQSWLASNCGWSKKEDFDKDDFDCNHNPIYSTFLCWLL